MNKIFKIVFNAARGKMMVVNEATSSVQTGKKAAVTVAAVGLGLLSSTTAFAERVIGGGDDFQVNALPETIKTSIELNVSEGRYEDVIGGIYAKLSGANYAPKEKELSFNFDSISTTIDQGVVIEESAIAGNRHARDRTGGGDHIDNYKIVYNTQRTDLVVDGAEFIGEYKLSTNDGGYMSTSHNNFITAGDYMKDRGENYKKVQFHESNIDSANVTIKSGKINALVFGGSVMDSYSYQDVNMTANVETANVNILGGEFKQNIFAGGAVFNGQDDKQEVSSDKTPRKVTSYVKTANLNISNVELTTDVYAGGLTGLTGAADPLETWADVGVSNVTIKDATVANVYGANADGLFTNYTDKPAPLKGWTFSKGDAVTTNVVLVNSTVTGVLDVEEGSVELRVEGEDGKVSVGTLSAEGKILTLSADGVFNDFHAGEVDALKTAIQINGEAANIEGATVKLDEGSVMGAVTVGADGQTTVAVNQKTEALAEQVTLAPQMIQRIMMNDVRKRMGDLRAAEGTHGVWARYNGGQLAGSGMEADFNMVQVGIDTVPVVDAPRFGVAFSYAQTEADATNGLATTDMDAFSLAFYGTKMYDNGMFVDVIGRMATMDTEMTVQGNKAEMDNVALSLSGELGWRFDVTDQFFIEPSAELTYTYTNADTFKMGQGTYELESTDSLVGRAGFAAGFKCPANKGDVYVRAAVVHEFMGDSTMNSMINGRSATPVESDGEDTYFEYAVGAQFNVNKNTYVYADIERTEGANVDEDWRANVGVRFAF